MDHQVVLDEKSFKALAADSRVNILKNLTDRRRTLTELSQKLSLGSSTIKEHCDILVHAELIKQIDEGRKWKYYELTTKGKQIIQPSFMEEIKVLIVLCLSTMIVGGFLFILLTSLTASISMSASRVGNAPILDQAAGKTLAASTTLMENACAQASSSVGITPEVFGVSVLIALIAGIILGWYFTRKR